MKRRRLVSRVTLIGAVAATIAVLGVMPATAASTAVVLLEDLSSPKGLAVIGREPVVSQGAFGPPGPVLQYLRTGPSRGSTVEVSPANALMDIAIGPDGTGWAIGVDRLLYRQEPGEAPEAVFDIAAYQEGDPDPTDLDGDPTGSNPYGLAALRDGSVLVADAQNNDVLRVGADGSAVTVARFLPEEVGTGNIPFPPPPEVGEEWPPTLPAEAVPTGIAIGRDGWAYVSELKGFPFELGSSNVYRLNPLAEDAVCSTTPNSDCRVAMTGFTSLIDIAIDTRNGTVYTYGLAAEGTFAFEEGFGTGEFPPAVLTQVKNGKQRQLASGQLSEPGGVSVARDGTVFVTDGMFTGGRLVQIRGG